MPPRFMPGGPDSVPQRVSAAVRAGSVDARSLRCHANSFTARGGGLLIIAIGIAWPFILAVCVGIEESAVARLPLEARKMHTQQMKSESFSDIGYSFPRVAGERTHTKFTLAAYDKPLRYV